MLLQGYFNPTVCCVLNIADDSALGMLLFP